jgi:hypothetical protein
LDKHAGKASERLTHVAIFPQVQTSAPKITVAQALEQLAGLGVRIRSGISQEDLLLSLGGTIDSPVD